MPGASMGLYLPCRDYWASYATEKAGGAVKLSQIHLRVDIRTLVIGTINMEVLTGSLHGVATLH